MMLSKLYLLLAVLFVFVICSTSVEEKRRKTDSVLDSKKKVSSYAKDDEQDKQEKQNEKNEDDNDRVDDGLSQLTSYAHNRYSPEGNNYRTRPRWQGASAQPSPYDNSNYENDWSRSGYENGYSAVPSPISYDNDAMFGNGPTCHSLVDAQYPIISDICGAVPQARYALPNSFGHRERWHVAQALTTLMSSSTDPACTRSLRLLVCPVLFPPCQTRHEPPPTLPCQSYCRAVKSRCSIPSLDLLPCELFPYSSDFCPTNQQYGSFMPQGAFPSGPQQFPMPGGPSPSNYQQSRSFPSLQSILSLAGFQSGSPSSPSPFNPQQSLSPSNFFNNGPYGGDSLGSMLGDYQSRPYNNDYRQSNDYRQPSSRYAPSTRSSTETQSTANARATNEARPAAARSSVVRA